MWKVIGAIVVVHGVLFMLYVQNMMSAPVQKGMRDVAEMTVQKWR